jgi:hypothetical protein
MVRSLSVALEEAMAKKSSKHHITHTGPIHGSFPAQAAPQPSSMGSQSVAPGMGMDSAMTAGMPPGIPSPGETPTSAQSGGF